MRYADDLVVLCAREVAPSLTVLRHLLEGLGLKLNEEKPRAVNARQDRFDFLGFSFGLKHGRHERESLPARGAVPSVHPAGEGTRGPADRSPSNPDSAPGCGEDAQPVRARVGGPAIAPRAWVE